VVADVLLPLGTKQFDLLRVLVEDPCPLWILHVR
jgi:hypothetical protein